MAHINVYGSSTVYGLWAERSWPEQIKLELNNQRAPLHTLGNRGKTGSTIADSIALLEQDDKQWGRGRKLAVGQFGAFESSIPKTKLQPVTKLKDFRSRLEHFGSYCVNNGIQLILVEIPPVDESLTNPVTGSGCMYINNHREQYIRVTKEYAEEKSLTYVPIWDALGGTAVREAGYSAFDGIHLNQAGHDVIAGQVIPVIKETLAVKPKVTLIPDMQTAR